MGWGKLRCLFEKPGRGVIVFSGKKEYVGTTNLPSVTLMEALKDRTGGTWKKE